MKIWRGRVISQGYVHPHPHPHTQLKKLGISHTHTQSMRRFPVKTGTGSDNTHEDEFIYHLLTHFLPINLRISIYHGTN